MEVLFVLAGMIFAGLLLFFCAFAIATTCYLALRGVVSLCRWVGQSARAVGHSAARQFNSLNHSIGSRATRGPALWLVGFAGAVIGVTAVFVLIGTLGCCLAALIWLAEEVHPVFAFCALILLIKGVRDLVRRARRSFTPTATVSTPRPPFHPFIFTRSDRWTTRVEPPLSPDEFQVIDVSLENEAPTCLVCHESINGSRALCRRCHTPHHIECWEYLGHCAIFACGERRCIKTPLPPPPDDENPQPPFIIWH